MKQRPFLLVLVIVLVFALAACGGGQQAGGGAAAERGKALFEQATLGPKSAPGCSTCHSLEPDKVIVGPSLARIATTAAAAVPGMSAEAFLRESIVNPEAHITAGFPAGVMYQYYGRDLSEQQINDLVAFLLTLK
jgi:cytochrome c551/c552